MIVLHATQPFLRRLSAISSVRQHPSKLNSTPGCRYVALRQHAVTHLRCLHHDSTSILRGQQRQFTSTTLRLITILPRPSPPVNDPGPRSPARSPSRRRFFRLLTVALFLAVPIQLYFFPLNLFERPDAPDFLHPTVFRPFVLVSREPAARIADGASCDSAVFTFKPVAPVMRHAMGDEVGKRKKWQDNWEKGVWSVQVKQPDVMVARSYTPLPPVAEWIEKGEQDTVEEVLKFYVKREPAGEVSRWLFSLPVGSEVGLRGPAWEWVYPEEAERRKRQAQHQPEKLSEAQEHTTQSNASQDPVQVAERDKRIVFLAGGTGIAPAMQVAAHYIAGAAAAAAQRKKQATSSTTVFILWAVRSPADIAPQLSADFSKLQQLADSYSSVPSPKSTGFSISYHADSQGNVIRPVDIASAVLPGLLTSQPVLSLRWLPKLWGMLSQSQDTPALVNTESPESPSTTAEDKYLLVSGPDGFIAYFAGAKPVDGSQGKLGGMFREVVKSGRAQEALKGGDDSEKNVRAGDNLKASGLGKWFVWKL